MQIYSLINKKDFGNIPSSFSYRKNITEFENSTVITAMFKQKVLLNLHLTEGR